MRILITNDDGIGAPALPILASRLARAGHDVQVGAPSEGHSGCGASIGKVSEGQIVSMTPVSLAGAEEIPAFAVDAPPALIVLAAVQGFFGQPPGVVVSGPNSGLNLGPLVLHSGTLGAAVTAAANGMPGIALSTERQARFGMVAASEFCARNLGRLVSSMGQGLALNVNVPDRPIEQVSGIRLTRFAPRSLVAIELSEHGTYSKISSGTRRMCISLEYDVHGLLHRRWRDTSGQQDDTDAGAIIDGCISITVVHGGLQQVDSPTMLQAWQTTG